jgi:uncharacterized protein GlcG (DUF336 family)
MKITKKHTTKPRGRAEEKKHSTRDAIREAYTNGPKLDVQIIPAKGMWTAAANPRDYGYAPTAASVPMKTRRAPAMKLQVQNYTQMIQNNPAGYSRVSTPTRHLRTSVLHREHFLEMIEDCKAGKIDLIITKQVSRFARNVLDSLSYIRLASVARSTRRILFETEGLNTLDSQAK